MMDRYYRDTGTCTLSIFSDSLPQLQNTTIQTLISFVSISFSFMLKKVWTSLAFVKHMYQVLIAGDISLFLSWRYRSDTPLSILACFKGWDLLDNELKRWRIYTVLFSLKLKC